MLIFLFFLFFFFWGGGAETPIFIVFSAKNAKFKETQKRKKTLFVNTIVLTALVKVSVFFLHFRFLLFFFNFRFFEDVFVWFPKIKKYKKKQSKQNQKQEQKEDKRCKAKTNELL